MSRHRLHPFSEYHLQLMMQNLKGTVDRRKDGVMEVITDAQHLLDDSKDAAGMQLQYQRLRCNTSDLLVRLDGVCYINRLIT